MDALNVITLFLFNIAVYNIPLLYGTVGEIIIEKSGSLNLGVEGTMAVGAIIGYLAGSAADSMLVGMLVAFGAAGLCGLIFAFLTVTLQANQNVTGLTLTTFGLGLYFFIGKGMGSGWPQLTNSPSVKEAFSRTVHIPLLSDIPIIGKGLFSHNIFIYLGVAIAVLAFVYLKYTRAGLVTRAVGENPAAADAAGVNIARVKYLNIIAGSGIMGLGGYYMGLNMHGSFEGSSCWIGGYGWISIALVIFANWNPAKAILGTLIFGFFATLSVYNSPLASAYPTALGWLTAVPNQLYIALPYIITATVLILESVRKRKNKGEPAAKGLNYFREDR